VTKFLLDANLSTQTATFLSEAFDLDVVDLRSLNPSSLRDREVIELAKRERRVIITFDVDFGELYYLREKAAFGAIVLRLRNQTPESVNRVLANFLTQEAPRINLESSLVVVTENRVRTLTLD
jgi:predicted nuclease of predicted toxin-antitoxin system